MSRIDINSVNTVNTENAGENTTVANETKTDSGNRVLLLRFKVKNLKPSKDLTIWVDGNRNKLSASAEIVALIKGDVDAIFLKGAHGPKWTDGQELNYKRRRIEYQQEEMITHGFFIPPEFADLPPEMRDSSQQAVATDWLAGLATEVDRLLAANEHQIHEKLTNCFERILISRALAHTGGRRIEAAVALGIGRNTITRKIQELGMDGARAEEPERAAG